MKYIVSIGDQRVAIDAGPDGIEMGGARIPAHLVDVPDTPVRVVRIGSEVHRVVLRRRLGRGHYVLWIDGYTYEVEALDERTRAIRDLTAAVRGPLGPAPIIAPMPGLVVRTMVAAGDRVAVGQGLVVMEAMKMENELRAAGAGTVRRVNVSPGMPVEKGAVLIELE
jgi:pyruvate carboxylase subunit B